MKIKLFMIIGLFAIGLFSNAVVAGKTSERLFINAQAVFERSLAGDDSVTGVALNQFRILSMTYRENPLFLAYQGACYTLMGRDAFWPWNKTGYPKKGLDIIGKALLMLKPVHDFEKMRGVPISVETRLVAVSTFSGVPKSFKHFEKAKVVLKDLFQSSAFSDSPVPIQAHIYWHAAKIALKENQRDEEISAEDIGNRSKR